MKKIFFIILLFCLTFKAKAETYDTSWGFSINVNDEFIYMGEGNLDVALEYGKKNNLFNSRQIDQLRNALKDPRMIMFLSKKYPKAQINANTQKGSQKPPRNKKQINAFCEAMVKNYTSIIGSKVKLVDCELDFVAEKQSFKYPDLNKDKIDSIILLQTFVKKYSRSQYQYYVTQDDQVTTFTLGCDIKNCAYLNTELLKIVNSIKFIKKKYY